MNQREALRTVKRHLAASVLEQLPPPSLLEGLGERDAQRMTLAWGELQQQLSRWAEGPCELEARALAMLGDLESGEVELAFLASDASSVPRVRKTLDGLLVRVGICSWEVEDAEAAVELLTRSRRCSRSRG